MATNYTAYQTACANARAALNTLNVALSTTAAASVSLTGTYDSSGDLINRVNQIIDWANFMTVELARTNGSIAS